MSVQPSCTDGEPAEKKSPPSAVDEVWGHYVGRRQDYYRRKNGRASPAPKLTKPVRELIKRRSRDGYTVEDMVAAVDGMFETPHNLGENDRGREYLDLQIALRINGEQNNLERFRDYQMSMAASNPADDPLNDPHGWERHGIIKSSNSAKRWCSRAGAWIDATEWRPREPGEEVVVVPDAAPPSTGPAEFTRPDPAPPDDDGWRPDLAVWAETGFGG